MPVSKRYLRWNKELTEADRDGFIHEFTLRVGNSETIVTASCSGTIVATFVGEREAVGWTDQLVALALCAQAVKDKRRTSDRSDYPLDNHDPHTSLSVDEARELAGGREICLDRGVFG